MSFPYKNPLSASQVSLPNSVERSSTQGTHFSVLGVGGYMEVYSLSDLDFTVPISTVGPVEYSGNTIPIQLNIGVSPPSLPDFITLNSDNISSGRRRLGMMVYVHEVDTVYQFHIPNYDALWASVTGLTGSSAITISDYTTTVNGRSQAGQDFIAAWSASTVRE